MSSIIEQLKDIIANDARTDDRYGETIGGAIKLITLQARLLRQIAESDGYACSICGGEAEHKAGCELAKAINASQP